MPDRSFLDWPFFEDRHRALAAELETWCKAHLPADHGDVDEACRGLVAQLLAGATGETLSLSKRNKKGKLVDVDVRPRVKEAAAWGEGFRVVLGASPNAAEGPLGLFDFLRAAAPDLEEHPMTLFRIDRTRFLRADAGGLVPAVDGAGEP